MKYKKMDSSNFAPCCNKLYFELNDMRAENAVHYCTMQTMDAILKEGYLRAVDSRFMNDLGEYEFGNNILKKRLSNTCDLEDVVPMTVSFSTKTDLVPQWALYAKEIGIEIQFDFSFHEYWQNINIGNKKLQDSIPTIAQQSIESNKYIDTGIPYPIKLIYFDGKKPIFKNSFDKLIKTITTFCKNADVDYMAPKGSEIIPLAATFIKSAGFNYEHEARISTFLVYDDSGLNKQPKVQFHANGAYLRPYVNICYIYSDENGEYNIGWPISGICVGPGRNQEKAIESVIKRLEFGEVKILPLPYTVFLARLKVYTKNMVKNFFNDEYSNIKSEANKITSNLLKTSDKFLKTKNGRYFKCIDGDNYKKAKDCIRIVKERFVKFSLDKGRNEEDVMNFLREYEKRNYFSWYGIYVHASDKTLSFI